ncbi:hypothetical protein FRC00_011323 [Tulasnella sp. 408]|nr:hypothetical protein FRC00_011323 [Tulasnella sp. 408]
MSNPPSNWTRTAVTGRIRVVSSNLGAGQYICRNVGARNNLKTCDEYEDALKVRIAPADDTVILECPNANASGMHWLGLAASSDGEFGKNSSECV